MAPKRKQQQRRTVPLAFNRGQWSGGDAAMLAAGYCRRMRNFVRKDGVWVGRAPFTFDGLTAIHGLATWEDDTNKITRLIAIDDSGNLRVKATDSELWGAVVTGTVTGTRLTSFATYRGVGYGTLDDGAGVPTDLFSFNGSEVDADPLNSAIVARSLLFYKERMFLFHPRVTVTNLLPWQAAYSAAGGLWNLADVDARTITQGAATIGEIIPTADTGAFMYRDIEQITALVTPEKRVYQCDVHNTSPSYQMPLTIQLRLVNPWEVATPYVVDEIVTPSSSNGYRYRATVAGTSDGATEPTWPTVIGDTVTDNGITWLCDAENVLGEEQAFAPTASIEQGFTRYVVNANLPPTPGSYTLRAYVVFGNDTSSTITPVALHIGYCDGLAADDPAKRNYGQQVTAGDYYAPFFNREDDVPAVIDLDEILWSEVAFPKSIRAISTYNLGGTAGYVTAAAVFDGRIYVFKRRASVRFVAVDDANLVILPETDETLGVGCLGPRAIDIHPGVSNEKTSIPPTLYWIGENGIYSQRAGVNQVPRDITGDRMRSEIMNKDSASWIEDQATHNTPELRVDQHNHTVWVKTQKGVIYVYDIADDAWSTIDAGGTTAADSVGEEIRTFLYHPVTHTMYVSFGTAPTGTAGLARLDTTQAVSQAAHQVHGLVSTDGGTTFPYLITSYLTATENEKFVPSEFPLYQSWSTLQPRLIFVGVDDADQISTEGVEQIYKEIWPRALETSGPHTDLVVEVVRYRYKAGAIEFAVSEMEADMQLMRGYYPKSLSTFGGSTL